MNEKKLPVKNLLFDLGGVVVDIRRENCVRAFEALGLPDADSYFGEYAQTGIFMALEDGSATVDEFHEALKKAFPEGKAPTHSHIDDAFQRFIVGIPVERLEALEALRSRFGIYLLSNTNPIMWNGVLASEFAKRAGKCREDYFDGMVTSFEARSAKPDEEIFRYTARHLGLDPAETLFFDDSTVNVEAARRCGYQAVHVPPGREFTDIISSLKL